jgi:hypothetical protein
MIINVGQLFYEVQVTNGIATIVEVRVTKIRHGLVSQKDVESCKFGDEYTYVEFDKAISRSASSNSLKKLFSTYDGAKTSYLLNLKARKEEEKEKILNATKELERLDKQISQAEALRGV